MTRITMVMAGDEEGGLEKHVVELSNGLAARGYSVSVIAHAKYQSRLSHDVSFYALDLSRSRRNPLVLWQLYQAIKQSQPQLLHVQANKAVAMVAPLLNWLKVPAVATLHNRKKQLKAFGRFDRIIAVSQQVATQFEQTAINAQNKVRVVLNGVAIQHAPKPDLNPDQKTSLKSKQNIQAIAIGRLVTAKGFDLLIEAWQGISANLWIVGDGSDIDALHSQIQQAGLADRIELLGHRHDIADLLTQADVFIISSRNEGGPYTLAEALLLQTPVLATQVGMVPDVLPVALTCEPNNSVALHQLLQTYVPQLKLLHTLSEPVYQFAQDHLSFEAMLTHTIAVYEELLQPAMTALAETPQLKA